ncbi:response regulator transcription factor [Streptomyces sp. AV19]|uniref:response regulator transcription factor n=1 Tax=Streptomyces sp. AV19 TaxID=2793068 RepID=UPI0018FEFA5C|nr:response regulator transcription factor [Streptomyces sp. AV19]MBH1936935.1 response regulator transcription factor [Streptomyces sp. AV19]MDG4532978.1 response regulator transcription factor [Streptomyces sp. AV19]
MDSDVHTRVVVCDRHPYARLGIRGALKRDPAIAVVGEAGNIVELVPVTELHDPDVVVLEAQAQHLDKLSHVDAAVVVVVADAEAAADWIRFTQANVRAVVHSDDPEDDLVKAVRRASNGAGYVSPGLSSELMRLVRTTVPRPLRPVPTHTPLTSREAEVLQLVRRGLANKEIARRLGLSEKTVKFHVSNVLAKAHMASRAQLIASAASA